VVAFQPGLADDGPLPNRCGSGSRTEAVRFWFGSGRGIGRPKGRC